jgi:hypothetical protein
MSSENVPEKFIVYLEDDPIRFTETGAGLTFEKVKRSDATTFANREAATTYIRRSRIAKNPDCIVGIVRLLPSEAVASTIKPVPAPLPGEHSPDDPFPFASGRITGPLSGLRNARH